MFDLLLLGGIFISLLAGQFARIELINGLANVYIHEFLLFIFVCYSVIRFGFSPIKKILKIKEALVFLVLLIFSFVISIPEFNVLQNSIAFLYFLRVMLYLLFGIYLFTLIKQDKKVKMYLLKLIYTFSILLLIITVIQYIFFPNFWGLYAFGWDPHLYRASAIYLDVFVAAAIYGMLALFWFSRNKKVLSFLFVIALVLSFSRSAYVAFIVSIVYFFIAEKKWKELLVSLCLFVLLVIAVPKPFGEGVNLLRTSSINSRILDYERAISLWQKKPLFGFGYNRIRPAKEQTQLIAVDDRSHSLSAFHSSFLVVLVTTGIVGFLSFAMLVGSFFKKYSQMRVYLIFILSMSLFDNVLLHVLVLLPFLCIAAMIL